MAYDKNQLVSLVIEDIGMDGEGIGHIDGYTFFVKDAVIGDRVTARITKATKTYAYARVEKVEMPSSFRVIPKCPISKQCGGCQIQAMDYDHQLAYKYKKVKNNLIRIGGFTENYVDWRMDKIIGMEEPWRYRNKAQYPIGTDKDGNIIAGFYAGRTHSIIGCEDCYIGDEGNAEILDIILNHMRDKKIKPYNEETRTGLVRHVLIRRGFTSKQWMVCIIINMEKPKSADSVRKFGRDRQNQDTMWNTNNEMIPGQGELVLKLSKVEGMESISININSDDTNVIMGKDTYCIWGEPYISDTIHVRDMSKEGYPLTGKELEFHISPQSFYQVNPIQTEKLYSLALQYAGLTGKESVWDLYCGIGTISLFMAGQAGTVYGVEIVPQAINDAKENANRNGIMNAEFFVGKAEEVFPDFYNKRSLEKSDNSSPIKPKKDESMLTPDVIVVDPPRKGCDKLCLETMVAMKPRRIVYVSCDSATLARDLKYLVESGYEIGKIRPVDMFPHTVHVETVCLLTRKD